MLRRARKKKAGAAKNGRRDFPDSSPRCFICRRYGQSRPSDTHRGHVATISVDTWRRGSGNGAPPVLDSHEDRGDRGVIAVKSTEPSLRWSKAVRNTAVAHTVSRPGRE